LYILPLVAAGFDKTWKTADIPEPGRQQPAGAIYSLAYMNISSSGLGLHVLLRDGRLDRIDSWNMGSGFSLL
jgi:hypothetical protein